MAYTEYNFNPEEARDKIVALIKREAELGNFSKVVVGISGGKDSTVTAALCARALGKENVIGVLMPDGVQNDIKDSYNVCEALGIPHITINIGFAHEAIQSGIEFAKNNYCSPSLTVPYSEDADINVPPRLRMVVLRVITQSLNARLAGTGNLSEATVGYCTKDGDTSCDISILGGLTSVEVVQVGLTMDEIPKELVLKTPSDGLCGMSDEEKLGLSYEDIHNYIRNPREAAKKMDVFEKIQKLQFKNAHKQYRAEAIYDPCDWRYE